MRRALLFVALTACGFPNVMFKDASPSADSSDEEMLDADLMPEHVDPPLPDAGDSGKVMLADSGKPCDKDNDTYVDQLMCMGNDCDDTDDRAHPGINQYLYIPATPTTKGDWNCNNTIETEVATVNLKCTDYPYGSNCAALAGFDSNPPCGYFGNYVTCKSGGLLATCVVNTAVMRKQGCK